jgi:hypothetical protein
MKLSFFSRKYVEVLRTGAAEGVSRYGSGTEWLDTLLPGQPYVHESGYVVDPPPQLLSSDTEDTKNDGENAIRIHRWLRSLQPSVAMEERLWAYLAHVPFNSYMSSRWPVKNEGEVRRRYLFEGASFGALARQGIARLWWAAHLTHNPEREDPYELTRAMFFRQDIQLALMDRALGKCNTVRTSVLEFLQDNKEWFADKSFGRRIQLLMKELNLLGGVVILDALPYAQVRQFVDSIGRRVAGRE